MTLARQHVSRSLALVLLALLLALGLGLWWYGQVRTSWASTPSASSAQIMGVKAITPTHGALLPPVALSGELGATYSAKDVLAYLTQHGDPSGLMRTRDGRPPTVIPIQFVGAAQAGAAQAGAAQAGAAMEGSSLSGVKADHLVCLVILRGQFPITNIPGPGNLVPLDQTQVAATRAVLANQFYTRGELVFDGTTGNLLGAGISP
jgi:hypothetical protein